MARKLNRKGRTGVVAGALVAALLAVPGSASANVTSAVNGAGVLIVNSRYNCRGKSRRASLLSGTLGAPFAPLASGPRRPRDQRDVIKLRAVLARLSLVLADWRFGRRYGYPCCCVLPYCWDRLWDLPPALTRYVDQ